MAAECNGNCEGCSSKGSCNVIPKEKLNEYSHIGKVIGIVSGKGGVGKSTVTSLIARKLVAEGKRVGIMDADLTGPSIPKCSELRDRCTEHLWEWNLRFPKKESR